MSNVRTVSDTKRAFHNAFSRPIASVYRRVIEELMVEMHLLSVSTDFVYDPIYALGIVTTYDRFMDGYRPEGDTAEIFAALCQAVGASPEQYRQDAQQLLAEAEGLSIQTLKEMLALATAENALDTGLAGTFKAIGQRDRFKYSRAYGIGFYTVIEKLDAELVKDKDKLMELAKESSEALSISFDKLQKDIELYRSNLDKMVQAKAVMADMLAADRKKREERAQALAEKETADNKAAAEPAHEPAQDAASAPTGDAGDSDKGQS